MSLDADQIIDRRRLKRKLTFWRLFAIAVVVVAVVIMAGRIAGGGDYIARLDVSGLITEDYERDKALSELAGNASAKALIVTINSPGGTVVGGEDLYRSIKAVGGKKPVVILMGSTAASAAYMAALAGNYIIAREGTVTGSIGVLMQTADVTVLLDKLGIKPESVKSNPLKAQPNPMEPFSDAARKVTKDVIMDLFSMFVDLVALRRNIPRDRALKMADGRIFTGRQAKENGLIDAIGSMPDGRKWLWQNHKIADSLPLRDVEINRKVSLWRDILGMSIGKTLFSERLGLDVPTSLWHPSAL